MGRLEKISQLDQALHHRHPNQMRRILQNPAAQLFAVMPPSVRTMLDTQAVQQQGSHLCGKLAPVQRWQARQLDGDCPLEPQVFLPYFIHKENKHAYP